MTDPEEKDIVERLLDKAAASLSLYRQLYEEAAQTIAALRAERDIADRNRDAARDNFLTMQQSAAMLLKRSDVAEAKVKELEAEISNLDAELDHWSQLAVDDLGKNPPTSWKEIANTAIRERDDARKALEPFAKAADELDDKDEDHYELWEHSVAMSITVGDLRRARSASSNREGGE